MLASMLYTNRARVKLGFGETMDGYSDAKLAADLLDSIVSEEIITESAIKARGMECKALELILDESKCDHPSVDWIVFAEILWEWIPQFHILSSAIAAEGQAAEKLVTQILRVEMAYSAFKIFVVPFAV